MVAFHIYKDNENKPKKTTKKNKKKVIFQPLWASSAQIRRNKNFPQKRACVSNIFEYHSESKSYIQGSLQVAILKIKDHNVKMILFLKTSWLKNIIYLKT